MASALLVLIVMAGCGDDDGGSIASLAGTSWSLAEGAGITIPDGVTMTIAFEDGRTSGAGGCNRFTGSYEEEGDSISFGALATTRMACREEVMNAENAYLAALDSASTWSATEDELVLSDGSGEELLRHTAARHP